MHEASRHHDTSIIYRSPKLVLRDQYKSYKFTWLLQKQHQGNQCSLCTRMMVTRQQSFANPQNSNKVGRQLLTMYLFGRTEKLRSIDFYHTYFTVQRVFRQHHNPMTTMTRGCINAFPLNPGLWVISKQLYLRSWLPELEVAHLESDMNRFCR